MHTTRRRWLIPAVLVLAIVAVACNQSNTPQTYGSVTHNNFLSGCTGEGAGTVKGTTTTLAAKNLCECMYTVITAAMPASDKDKKERGGGKTFADYQGPTFDQLNLQLQTNPDKIPSSLKDDFAKSCQDEGYRGTTTTTSSSGGGGPTTTAKK
jgi:hypothetical protein